LLARPTPKLENRCLLSVTAYSIYSQLPSTFEEDLLYEEPEDAPCHGDGGPTQQDFKIKQYKLKYLRIF
jgi:hypothetical protein